SGVEMGTRIVWRMPRSVSRYVPACRGSRRRSSVDRRRRRALFARQLVREQRERDAPPRELRLVAQRVERGENAGEPLGGAGEGVERAAELVAPLRCVELAPEPLGGDRV